MAEGCGRVLLQQEMASPGEAVAQRNPEQRVPGMMRCEGHDCHDETQRRSDGMHPAISRVAVLFQIEGKELVVGTECSRLSHRRIRLARRPDREVYHSSSQRFLRFVSGHDFSRAEQGAEKVGALAPAPAKPAPSVAKAQVLC